MSTFQPADLIIGSGLGLCDPAIGHAQAFGPYNHPCGMSCPGYLSAIAST